MRRYSQVLSICLQPSAPIPQGSIQPYYHFNPHRLTTMSNSQQQPGPVLSAAAAPMFMPTPVPALGIPPPEPRVIFSALLIDCLVHEGSTTDFGWVFSSFIVLEWYPFNLSGTATYSEKDRRDVGIVPYLHPMTPEILLIFAKEMFGVSAKVDLQKLRLRRVVRGRDSWVKVAHDGWGSFLRPDDIVGIFAYQTL
ncbi:hypothetical protein BKA70DRAFT_1283677 [Coprinopsis sp. MPI-PUGE-AT-0042]|nr:hypothetical protein BKA70DRAFT_1283677 [Coprinopsis sp. MPI-PUGE-AT-0042]